ncbi:MAG: hypothetical protein RBT80_06265 [Candidatus Vecturithrix sp.]|jgi:hypothetical protein|nr:hypothetical protein [Candidatus Vecturithrix sp.]
MKWVEIIRLRLLDHLKQTAVINLVRQVAVEVSTPDMAFTLYHHATVETDMSIHLTWNSGILSEGKSEVGAKLIYMLQEFGFVDYSTWIEL